MTRMPIVIVYESTLTGRVAEWSSARLVDFERTVVGSNPGHDSDCDGHFVGNSFLGKGA